MLYVSINYRLGPLGFPQGAEAAARGLLNVGLKDQLAGLEWVQSHVKTFGGDPSKVCSPLCATCSAYLAALL